MWAYSIYLFVGLQDWNLEKLCEWKKHIKSVSRDLPILDFIKQYESPYINKVLEICVWQCWSYNEERIENLCQAVDVNKWTNGDFGHAEFW